MSIRVSRQEEVLMRTRALRWTAVLCLFAGSLLHAQDNPLPGFGITGGNNFRTYVYQAPVLAIDQDAPVKWKKDIGTTYNTRRSTFVNFVFDENGDLYFTGYYSTEVANSGVIKISKTDGSFLWASPLTDSIASDLTPIVGSDAVYSARYNNDFPTVYALNKSTGAVIWESDPLPKPVALNMALHNGTIYGVTTRDADLGVSYVFAIRASDGAILHATPIATSGDVHLAQHHAGPRRVRPGRARLVLESRPSVGGGCVRRQDQLCAGIDHGRHAPVDELADSYGGLVHHVQPHAERAVQHALGRLRLDGRSVRSGDRDEEVGGAQQRARLVV